MVTTPFPDGFKRERPQRDPYSSQSRYGNKNSTISKEDFLKSIAVNNETLKALQTIGKNVDTVVYREHQDFDKYMSELKDITEKQQEIEMQVEEERKQSSKRSKEELKILIGYISEVSGIKNEEVAKALADQQSEMFKKLPEDLANNIKALLKEDDTLITTIIEEQKQIIEKEKQRIQAEKDKTKKFFTNIIEKTDEVYSKNADVLKSALLGPINLLLAPMEDFFGFDIMTSGKEFLFGKEGGRGEEKKDGLVQKIGKKLFKKKPTPNDVANTGDMGSLLIYNTLMDGKKGKGEIAGEGGGGLAENVLGNTLGRLLPGMLSGLASGAGAVLTAIGPALLTFLGGAAVVGGIAAIAGLVGSALGERQAEIETRDTQATAATSAANAPAVQSVQAVRREPVAEVLPASSRRYQESAEEVAQRQAEQTTPEAQARYTATLDTLHQNTRNFTMSTPEINNSRYMAVVRLMQQLKQLDPVRWREQREIQLNMLSEQMMGWGGNYGWYNLNKDNPGIKDTFHTGGIIGGEQILAQRGEVILPIAESNYGLNSGIIQKTPDGGLGLNRSFQYEPPAINSNYTQSTIQNEDNSIIQEEQASLDFSPLERKLDAVISVLQSIFKKDAVSIQLPKQNSRDLDLLISGGAL